VAFAFCGAAAFSTGRAFTAGTFFALFAAAFAGFVFAMGSSYHTARAERRPFAAPQ
jgi:hypothetical protein